MGILQAKILKWVAMPSSRGSSWPEDRTQVSCITGGFLTVWATRNLRRFGESLGHKSVKLVGAIFLSCRVGIFCRLKVNQFFNTSEKENYLCIHKKYIYMYNNKHRSRLPAPPPKERLWQCPVGSQGRASAAHAHASPPQVPSHPGATLNQPYVFIYPLFSGFPSHEGHHRAFV